MARRKKIKITKKNYKYYLILVIIIALILAGFFVYDKLFAKDKNNDNTSNNTSVVNSYENTSTTGTIYDNFQIRFLELGNGSTGDSTFIKAGDVDILIDAGSEKGSAPIIESTINNWCSDGILEYVIVTHGDSDHISGMSGEKKSSKNYKNEDVERNGILYYYDVVNLIDFSFTNKTTQTMNDYKEARNVAVSRGTNHYTAGDCYNNVNGAKRHHVLDDGNDISFDILYNKYYYETDADENNYSVCMMFNYKDLRFMFTGDLEEKGEQALAAYYDNSTTEKTLPHVKLFKAGHHGSKTSSNDCLLSKITPEICCVCCCAGGSEYTNVNVNTFPTQEFIDRIKVYTDKVYVTSMIDENESRIQDKNIFKPLNGQITISSNGTDIGLSFTNSDLKLKDSAWFNEKIYVVDGKTCSGKGKRDFYTKDTQGAIQISRRTW